MFVNAFWLGVIATLAAEFLITAGHVIIADRREEMEEHKGEESSKSD